MTEQVSMFDDNNNMHVPIERVLDNLMERNKQLNLEVATLQAGNQMLREKILELESSAKDSGRSYAPLAKAVSND